MYLREMGTVPLLTREGEVEIAKRIERGKLAVIKSISRTPTIARAIMQMGEQLKADERSIRELVTFVDEELTDEKIDDRKRQVLRQIEAVRKAWQVVREVQGKARQDAEGRDDARQAQVPPGPRRVAARARRALAADSQDRVHRDHQAPHDRPDQGVGRGGHAREAPDRSHRAAGRSEEQEEPS